MLFIPTFAVLLPFAANLAAQVSATPISAHDNDIFSESQLLTWLSTTEAEVTYVSAPVRDRKARAGVGGDVTVAYCSTRTQNVCGGPCTVYTGGALCLAAPDTNCLRATANVGFCSNVNCQQPCNQFSSCGVRLDDGFCFTPSTVSIVVPFVPPDNTTSSAAPTTQTSITSTTPEQTPPTAPVPTSTVPQSEQTSALPHSGISQRTALIAGPVVGFLVALLLVSIAVFIYVRRRRRAHQNASIDTPDVSVGSDVDTRHIASPVPFPWVHDQQEPPPYIPTETQPGSVSGPPSKHRASLVSSAIVSESHLASSGMR